MKLQKTKSHHYILLISLLFISFHSNAQQNSNNNLIVKSKTGKGKNFIYQNKVFTKDQLSNIIVQVPAATKFYNTYQIKKRNSKIGYVVSGGFAIMSYGYFRKALNEQHDPETIRALLTSIFCGASSLIVSVISTANIVVGNNKFHQSIQTFNENVHNTENLGKIPLELNLQYSQNGLGLVLNF